MSDTLYPKPLDLSYLYEISDHDREFIKEMIATIVKITPPSIQEINDSLTSKNWKEMGRLVHKLKPSLLLLNIDRLTVLIRSLEDNAKSGSNVENIPSQVNELSDFAGEIVTDLDAMIGADTY